MAEIGRAGRNPRQGMTAKALKTPRGAPVPRSRPGKGKLPPKVRPKN